MKLLFLDFETFSPVPIQRGLDVYMRPAEIMLAQWALDGGPVHVHDFTEDPIQPQELMDLINDPEVLIVAHNATVDRLAVEHCWGIELPRGRGCCARACARARSLPGGLGVLAGVLECG